MIQHERNRALFMIWNLIQNFFSSISMADYLVIVINVLFILCAKIIVTSLSSPTTAKKILSFRINGLRGLNLGILLIYGYVYFYLPTGGGNRGIMVIAIFAIIYMAYLTNYLVQHVIHRNYGKPREIGGKTQYIETYQTRLLGLITSILIYIIATISIIHQLGFTSLLEAGGVLGFMGVILGLTQGSWAPDIISGLIILNSDMFEEGDIVEAEGGFLGRVYKTKMFHTEILNISNNHRIMIRNAQLRDRVIHNLSKFASAKGLRECLSFKIGYDAKNENVKNMFGDAFTEACQQDIPLEQQYAAEIKILDTGDHAVEWGIIFYVKNIEKILSIRRDFREVIYSTSLKHGIDLSTPITFVNASG